MDRAYRVLAEQPAELVARHRADSTYEYASHGARTLLGYDPEALLGMHALALLDEADRARFEAAVADAERLRASVRVSVRMLRRDGTTRRVEMSIYPAPGEPAEAPGEYVTVTRSAAEERPWGPDRPASYESAPDGSSAAPFGRAVGETASGRAEPARRDSDDSFRTLVENMEMAHLRFDLDGKLQRANRAGVRMLGYQRADEVLGQDVSRKLWPSRARFRDVLAKVRAGEGSAVEVPLRTREGARRTLQGALRLVRDERGEPVAVDGVLRDATEEVTARERLVHAREAAEAGSRAKSAFLANMSHEIRTPLNAIIGLSHLALESEPPLKHRDYLAQIHGAGLALLDVVNDVLDVSKIEAGKLTLESEPFEIDRVLDGIASVVAVRAAEKELEVAFWVDPEVPDELLGDRLRLGQVLMNLVSNAVKFTERGEILVAVEAVEISDGSARLRFSVRDSGIGMTAEQRRHLFQPFSQADSSTTRKYGGSGLGLAISQELVHMMGGQIEIESTPGKGSEFRFEVTLGTRTGKERAEEPRAAPDVRALRVLVVDDSQVARDVLTRSLLALGFPVCASPTAHEALATLLRADEADMPYQLALIDARMPGMDGPELAQAIAVAPLRRRPVTLLVSAHPRDEVFRGRELPMVRGFLRKPVSRSSLLDAIVEAVHGTATAPPAKIPEEREQPLKGLSLLVVEDNEINQVLARDLLEAAGAMVTVAGDGREAIRVASRAAPSFDLVLMDVQMPGMDGHATTRILRRQPETRDTPIVAMTAHAFDAERRKCLASGMNAHVAKPINPRELVQTVLAWARPEQTAQAAETPEVEPTSRSAHEHFDPSALATVFREPARQLTFLRKFVDSAARTLRELEPSWERRSFPELGFAGHKLKSSAKACGAHALAAVCLDLERYAREEDWARIEPLRHRAERLLQEVAQYVSSLEAAEQPDPAPTGPR